jgi:hypothetical protein
LCLFAAVMMLAGCESARKVFSSDKTAPDEFAVYSRPPLSLPPEYSLRPPSPGEKRPQDLGPQHIAASAILGKTIKTAAEANKSATKVKGSPGVLALLRETGGLEATDDIRAIVDQETSIISKQDEAFVDKLIFWVDAKPDQGTVVDADKEQKRIQENQALGKPITEGDTPQVTRKRGRKGLLDF